MPPKVHRRPAALVKGAARPPAAAPRVRRPAAAIVVSDPTAKFLAGEEVDILQVPVEKWKKHEIVVFEGGSYMGQICQAAGRFKDLSLSDGQLVITVLLTGTTNEELLKHGTGSSSREVRVHGCPQDCGLTPEGPLFLHSQKVRRIPLEKEGELTWEKNLEEGMRSNVDELEELRRKERELLERAKEQEKEPGRKEKKRKREKKEGEKRKEKHKEKGAEEVSSSSSASGRKRKFGGRTIAKKSLEVIFGGTGLDPKPRVRRQVLSFARRKLKRSRTKSSASSSSSSTGGSNDSAQESDLLQDQSKIRQIARFAPGVLTASGIKLMKENLRDLEGSWLEDSGAILPMTLRYVRSSLSSRLTGGPLRESMNLAMMLDLGLQGRICEMLDVGIQRLKSIEAVSTGASWQTAEKLELLPSMVPQIRSRGEMAAVNREIKADNQARVSTPGNPGKGWQTAQGAPKGKGKNSGKSEEKGGKGKKKNVETKQ